MIRISNLEKGDKNPFVAILSMLYISNSHFCKYLTGL